MILKHNIEIKTDTIVFIIFSLMGFFSFSVPFSKKKNAIMLKRNPTINLVKNIFIPPFSKYGILFHAHKFGTFQTACEFANFFRRKFDSSVSECEKRVIRAFFDIISRTEFGSALANDDISGFDFLSTEFFDAEPFRLRISAKLCAAPGFTMCHRI